MENAATAAIMYSYHKHLGPTNGGRLEGNILDLSLWHLQPCHCVFIADVIKLLHKCFRVMFTSLFEFCANSIVGITTNSITNFARLV